MLVESLLLLLDFNLWECIGNPLTLSFSLGHWFINPYSNGCCLLNIEVSFLQRLRQEFPQIYCIFFHPDAVLDPNYQNLNQISFFIVLCISVLHEIWSFWKMSCSLFYWYKSSRSFPFFKILHTTYSWFWL